MQLFASLANELNCRRRLKEEQVYYVLYIDLLFSLFPYRKTTKAKKNNCRNLFLIAVHYYTHVKLTLLFCFARM